MEKSQDALKTIGEMSKNLGVQPHILRYWEEQFSMLNPLKRAGGRRYYRSDDAILLHEIHRLIYGEGYTIKGAQKYLRDANKKPNKERAALHGVPANAVPVNAVPTNNGAMDKDLERKLIHIADGLRQALAS